MQKLVLRGPFFTHESFGGGGLTACICLSELKSTDEGAVVVLGQKGSGSRLQCLSALSVQWVSASRQGEAGQRPRLHVCLTVLSR